MVRLVKLATAAVMALSMARPALGFLGASPAALLSAGRATAFCPTSSPLSLGRPSTIASLRPTIAASRRAFSLQMKEREQTFIMIKPDAVQRGLVGDIIKRFEQKGFKLVALKMMQADEKLLKEHYKDLVKKPFFPSLLSYMTSGPVVPMVWEGDGVVAAGRVILGATKPSESAPGTVRGDYAIDVGRNVCHGSDAVDTAEREIGLWFPDKPLKWEDHSESWVYE
mmetsp:Transcript_17593/g.44456  ORF Transcript_17593/g.44456 Transcript_17593/m.44456 type:complete len:225 (+) Transcript_17593:3-677(+)